MGMWIIIIVELLAIPIGIWMLFLREKSHRFKICSIFLIVLGPIAASITAYLSFAKNPSLQDSGVLTPRNKSSLKQQNYGMSFELSSPPKLTLQWKDNVVVQPLGRKFPLSFENTKEGLLISMVVRSMDGKIVAKMIRNKWVLNPNNYFRKNFDAHSLEVIDELDIPILQIDYLNENTIRIGGVFFTESVNISDIYPDFPSSPNNIEERAVYVFPPNIVAIFGIGVRTCEKPKDQSGVEEIRTIAKSSIKPWFDYSDPDKIGIRKPGN